VTQRSLIRSRYIRLVRLWMPLPLRILRVTKWSVHRITQQVVTRYLSTTNPTSTGTTAFLSFATTTWSTATITARGALIYQAGGSTPAVAVLDFGSDKGSSAGDFQITFPAANATDAIIRIA
jgi:hypothetical protein